MTEIVKLKKSWINQANVNEKKWDEKWQHVEKMMLYSEKEKRT